MMGRHELIRAAVYRSPFSSYISHHLKGNSPALVLGHHERSAVSASLIG
jgi:hypothetical protein